MPERDPNQGDRIFSPTEYDKDQKPQSPKDRFLIAYYQVLPLFNINLAWIVMSLPIVTVFPALGGLYYAVLEFNQENRADWGTVWEGVKKHWQLSLKWGVLVSLVNIILAGNIWFYITREQGWAIFAVTFTIVLLILWMTINQFSFPLLLLQEEKKILLAIRNGYVIVMRRPLAALKVLLLNFLIAVVATLLPPLWIFIAMALILHIRTKTLLSTIEKIRQSDAERDAAKTHREVTEKDEEISADR